MEYTFERDGVKEAVELERWEWGVVYKDGSELHQFDSKGRFHQFKEINQPEVKMLVMRRTDDASKRFDLVATGDVQFFHFYRQYVFNMLSENRSKVKVYVFGWKDRVTGAASYNYILPDDRLITANHDIQDLTNYNIR